MRRLLTEKRLIRESCQRPCRMFATADGELKGNTSSTGRVRATNGGISAKRVFGICEHLQPSEIHSCKSTDQQLPIGGAATPSNDETSMLGVSFEPNTQKTW